MGALEGRPRGGGAKRTVHDVGAGPDGSQQRSHRDGNNTLVVESVVKLVIIISLVLYYRIIKCVDSVARVIHVV